MYVPGPSDPEIPVLANSPIDTCTLELKDVRIGMFSLLHAALLVMAKDRNYDRGPVKRMTLYPRQWDRLCPLNKGDRSKHSSVVAWLRLPESTCFVAFPIDPGLGHMTCFY